MRRAGREPAEDVKRRIVAACQQAGLTALSARMHLRSDRNDRVVVVQAGRKDHPYEQCSVSIMSIVTLAGNCSGMDIRCAASDGDPNVWDIPVMRGRSAVPLEALAEAIAQTVEEQDQVVAALKMGVAGPYIFADTSWDRPSDPPGF